MPIAYIRVSAARSWSVLAEEGGTGLESVAAITPRETRRTDIWRVRGQPASPEICERVVTQYTRRVLVLV